MRHGDHICAAFVSSAEREEPVIDFVRGGLESGDQVWCFSPRQDASRLLALLHEALEVDGPLVRGQLNLVDPAEALGEWSFDPRRMLDVLASAVEGAAAGYGGIRFAGYADWALRRVQRHEQLEEWEHTLTEFYAERPAAGLCQYDRATCEHRQLERLIALHRSVHAAPVVSNGGLMRIVQTSSDGTRLRLAGELDISSAISWPRRLTTPPPLVAKFTSTPAGSSSSTSAGLVSSCGPRSSSNRMAGL